MGGTKPVPLAPLHPWGPHTGGRPVPEESNMVKSRIGLVFATFLFLPACGGDDDEELAAEIEVTLLHEIGHYFGLDEDELEKLGLG